MHDEVSTPMIAGILKNLTNTIQNGMKDNVISSQIVYFTTEKFDCVSEDLNQTLGVSFIFWTENQLFYFKGVVWRQH